MSLSQHIMMILEKSDLEVELIGYLRAVMPDIVSDYLRKKHNGKNTRDIINTMMYSERIHNVQDEVGFIKKMDLINILRKELRGNETAIRAMVNHEISVGTLIEINVGRNRMIRVNVEKYGKNKEKV